MKNSRIEFLIQKKLDRVADSQEENELDALIASSREISDTYTDQKQIHEWLKTVPNVEPPSGLVDSVMAALPVRPIRSAPWWRQWTNGFLLLPRHRFSVGFALGAAACLLFLSLVWVSRPLKISNYEDLYGSAVFSRQFSSYERIDLTRVGGEISWNDKSPDCMVRVALTPTAPVTAVLQFSQEDYRLSHFYQESWCEEGTVLALPNSIRVDFPKANRLVFILSNRGETRSPIKFKLLQGDTVLYSRLLSGVEEK